MSAKRMNVREGGSRPPRRRGDRGSVAVTVVLLLSFVATVVLAVAAFVGTQVRLAKAGENKVIGLTLAEAAVDDSIDKLTGDYNTATVASTTVYTDPPTNATPLGTYTATISAGAGYGEKKVVATGTPANGAARRVVANVTQGTIALGGAAILANGPVAIGGTGNIYTTPVNQHVADVFSNGNINLGGSGTDDGRLVSAGSVTGTGYYPSVTNASRYPFPTSAQIATLQSDWIAQSKSGTTPQIIDHNKVFQGNATAATIMAPAYIDGDLQLTSSQVLTLTGNGIVYINGNLKTVAGSQVINGSTLVVGGQLTMGGQSTYTVTSGLATMPTLAVLGSGDVTLNGGATNVLWGIIYAVNGGIKVNGNAMFTGALVSGGYNSTVSVTGTYTQYFPVNMASRISLPAYPKVTMLLEQ